MTVSGSAYAAGLAVEDGKTVDELSDYWQVGCDFSSNMEAKTADVVYARWSEAVDWSLDGACDGGA